MCHKRVDATMIQKIQKILLGMEGLAGSVPLTYVE
jgi:hypothetical protein